MLSKGLKPRDIFHESGFHSLFQVGESGEWAVKVLDRAGGHARPHIQLDIEPEIEVELVTPAEIAELRLNKEFTGTLPPEEAT